MEIIIEVSNEIADRLTRMFGADIEVITKKSLLRTLGEAELQQFTALKQEEIKQEAQRLNEEFGL